MSTSSRFAVATHILTLLALHPDEPMTSEVIARSVNTNPVVIRRVLGKLRTARLVTSQTGTGGGWRLAVSAAALTLREVYRAVEDAGLFALHQSPNPACPVGRNIQRALTDHFDAAAQAMEAELARTTIADMLRDTIARAA